MSKSQHATPPPSQDATPIDGAPVQDPADVAAPPADAAPAPAKPEKAKAAKPEAPVQWMRRGDEVAHVEPSNVESRLASGWIKVDGLVAKRVLAENKERQDERDAQAASERELEARLRQR